MKTISVSQSKKVMACFMVASFLLNAACSTNPEIGAGNPSSNNPVVKGQVGNTQQGKKKIKIALLLDTSNSMDGLIEQAKSQLWKFVNTLSTATFEKEKPLLEIALYEYGNDRLESSEGYIRQVSMFTNDLDLVSEKLFSLKTNGGNEFCGQVIKTSLAQLNWEGDPSDLRVIFIAGNEEFTQGPVRYTSACSQAKEKDVVVNTIYCGSFDAGIQGEWKEGAVLTNGNYMSIEQDRKTVYIESPYDAEISLLNGKLNDTYVTYGNYGRSKKMNQEAQDANSLSYGRANGTERAVSKASSFYSNGSWDLVDASKEKSFDVTKVKESDLPAELQGKTAGEKRIYIEQKNKERELIKGRIMELNKKRLEYIAAIEKNQPETHSLDAAMVKALKEQAGKKGFVFE